MTTHPDPAAIGANFVLVPPPAENKRDIHAVKGGFGHFLNHHRLAPEIQFISRRAERCQKFNGFDRKIPFFQAGNHLIANSPGGSGHGNMKLFFRHGHHLSFLFHK